MTEIILTSSFLILLLAAVRKLLRGRIAPTLQYALWLLVALRLLIPGTLFPTPVSVMGAANNLQSAIEENLPREDPADKTDHRIDIPAYPLPDAIPPEKTEDHGDTVITYYPPEATYPTPVQPVNRIDLIWKAGMILTGSALLASNLAFYIRLRKKRQRLSPQSLPLSCPAHVYLVEDLASPCLFGILRPSIYVNRLALEPSHTPHILAHENTHYRHGDHLWSLVRCLCLVIHWYNPLVWWAASLSRQDCELSCDAATIRRIGEERRIAYGQTLLAMITPGRQFRQLLQTATTMTAGKRTMKERISLIAKRPKMLKITLILVVLTVCAAVIVTFGGAGEGAGPDTSDTEASKPPAISVIPDLPVDPAPTSPGLTEAEALEIYRNARQVWTWFELGTLPTTDEVLQSDGVTLSRVENYNSLEQLRQHLLTLFSPALTDHLLTGYLSFQESDGRLYVESAGRGSNIHAGEEHVTAFLLTGETAARQNYDCHIYATTEVLDAYDLQTVLYEKRHDWHMAWNGQNYVFVSFGPHDDVDPQKYYNAQTILEHYKDGAGIITWWPMVACLDWNAVQATRDQWPEGFDLSMYILTALSEYVAGESSLTAAQMLHILSATEGLDGAYSEQFQFIVYELYRKAPIVFAYAVLDGGLSANGQAAILDYFRFEEQYHRASSAETATLSREEAIALLQTALSEGFSASPGEMNFTEAGQKAQFLPVSAYGIYAAAYTSSDPSVATVDELGFVEAVSPGTATITLRYDGAGGQREFTCAVTCEWSEPVAGPDPLQQRDGEVMMGIARGYGPSVFGVGSPQDLELSITGDWTLAGIESAILSAVQQHMMGTILEGDARAVTVSYAFRFPDKMEHGVTMEVPYFIDYVDTDVFTLPSGATHSPSGRTHELTAKVTLAGTGITAPVDGEFAAGQSLYDQLASCVTIGDMQVDHDLQPHEVDIGMEVIRRISDNLDRAGITGCHMEWLAFGSYSNPVWCAPGYTQTVTGTVSFRYETDRTASFPFTFTLETVE